MLQKGPWDSRGCLVFWKVVFLLQLLVQLPFCCVLQDEEHSFLQNTSC